MADGRHVQQCLGGFTYLTADLPEPTSEDEEKEKPSIICESDWAPNEILALTAMFTFHGIKFDYKTKYGQWKEKCPYILDKNKNAN